LFFLLQLVNPKLTAKKGEKYKNSGTIIFTMFKVRNSFGKLPILLCYRIELPQMADCSVTIEFSCCGGE
jgi:hypothetical protein